MHQPTGVPPVSTGNLSVSGVTGNVTLLELIAQDSSPANQRNPVVIKPRKLPSFVNPLLVSNNSQDPPLNTTLDLYGSEELRGANDRSWTKLKDVPESKIFTVGTSIKFENPDGNSKISPIAVRKQEMLSETPSLSGNLKEQRTTKSPGKSQSPEDDYIFKPVDVYVKGFKDIENLDRDYRLAQSQERLVLARRGVKISQVGEPGYLTVRAKEFLLNRRLSIFPGPRSPSSSPSSLKSRSPQLQMPETPMSAMSRLKVKNSPKSKKAPTGYGHDQTVFITSDHTNGEQTVEESVKDQSRDLFVRFNGRKLHSDVALQKDAKKLFENVDDSKIKDILETIYVGSERKVYKERMDRRLAEVNKIKKNVDVNFQKEDNKKPKHNNAKILKGLSKQQILEYYAMFLSRKGSASPVLETAPTQSSRVGLKRGSVEAHSDAHIWVEKTPMATGKSDSKEQTNRLRVAALPTEATWMVNQGSQPSQGSPGRASVSGESIISGANSSAHRSEKKRFKFKEGHFWFNPNAVDSKGGRLRESQNASPRLSKMSPVEMSENFSFKPENEQRKDNFVRGRLRLLDQNSLLGGAQLSQLELDRQPVDHVHLDQHDSASGSQVFKYSTLNTPQQSSKLNFYAVGRTDHSTMPNSPSQTRWLKSPGVFHKQMLQRKVSDFGLPPLSERIKAGIQQNDELQRLPAYQTRLVLMASQIKKGEV